MFGAGLILEGGGMRGVYTAGVLDLFLDRGIRFRRVYGVSAGACHACSYLSNQRERAVRTVVDFVDHPRYAGIRSLLTTGDFFGVQMIYDDIPNRLLPFDYESFAASGTEFTAVVTNLRTGQAEYRPIRDLRKDICWIQASSSLPLLSRSVRLEGERYLDGGISDSIPLARSVAEGNPRHVVLLTQHRGYRKEPSGLRRVMRARYRKYPALVEAMETRHLRYNATLDLAGKLEAEGTAFVIQPRNPVEIGRLERDRDKLRRLYRQGYEDAAARCDALLAFLQGKDLGALPQTPPPF